MATTAAMAPAFATSPSSSPSSPWLPLLTSGRLSDVTVVVDGIAHRLHRFPLFARSLYFDELFDDFCKEGAESLNFVCELSLPGGYATFRLVAEFCYGGAPALTAETAVQVLLAAGQLRMTEEHCRNNLIEFCRSFLKERVYSDWKKSLLLLERFDITLLENQLIADVPDKCQEAIAGQLAQVHDHTSKIEETLSIFRKSTALQFPFLQGVIAKLRARKLTFVPVGNLLAADSHRWLLHKELDVYLRKQPVTLSNGSGLEGDSAEFKRRNMQTILEYLVDALEFCQDSSENAEGASHSLAYKVTLLKCCHKLRLENHQERLELLLKKDFFSFSLADMKELDLEIMQSLVDRYIRKRKQENNAALPVLSMVDVLDSYLLWIACESAEVHPHRFQSLVEALPSEERENCDTLYDAVDRFLERNPDVNPGDRLRLCENLDPFKLSEEKTEHAVQNSRISLPPRFYANLFLAQKNRMQSLQGEVKELRKRLSTKDLALSSIPTQEVAVLQEKKDPVIIEGPNMEIRCDFSVGHLVVGRDGTIWAAGPDGLSYWRKDEGLSFKEVNSCCISSLSLDEEGCLLVGCWNGDIIVLENQKSFNYSAAVNAHTGLVTALLSTSSRKQYYSGGEDSKMKEWTRDGSSLKLIWVSPAGDKGHKGTITALCEDINGHIWSAANDGTIKCWKDKLCIRTMTGDPGRVLSIVAEKYLWVGGPDGKVMCWNLEGELLSVMEGHSDSVQALALGKDGVLWSAGHDNVIRGWKGPWKEGRCVAIMKGHEHWIWVLAMAPDGSLWSASADTTMMMWKPQIA